MSSKASGLSLVRTESVGFLLSPARPERVGKHPVVDQSPHHAVESRRTILGHAESIFATMLLVSGQLCKEFVASVVVVRTVSFGHDARDGDVEIAASRILRKPRIDLQCLGRYQFSGCSLEH